MLEVLWAGASAQKRSEGVKVLKDMLALFRRPKMAISRVRSPFAAGAGRVVSFYRSWNSAIHGIPIRREYRRSAQSLGWILVEYMYIGERTDK